MKIAVNTRLLLKSRMEGIARYNYESLKRMVANHPEDEFYFFFDRPYDEVFIFGENVHPIQLFPPTRHPFLIIFWFEWKIYHMLKKIKADVFLSGDTYMSLRSKVPTLLVCHDLAYIHYPDHIPIINRNYYRYFFPRFHKKAKKIVSVSEYTKSDIVNQYKIDPEKIRVGHNASNGHFHPIAEEKQKETRNKVSFGKSYFVYLGSIHPRKNIENLIRGFNEFKEKEKSDYFLLIIGRPAWNTESFYKTLNSSPFKNDIIHEQISRKEVPEYVGSSEALCYVSLFEGFGIPILEGFEAGVPVITSNVSSMPEVAGDAALLVDPAEPKSIAEAMSVIANDKKRAQDLVKAGKKRLKEFSWERTSETLYEELTKIAKSNK